MPISQIVTNSIANGAVIAADLAAGAARANFGAGAVLQVVEASTTTQTSSTSTTWVNTGLSGSITPSATSSRIAVMWTSPCLAGTDSELQLQLLRNGSAITSSYKMNNTAGNIWGSMTGVFLDAPSSVSAVTYLVQLRRINGNNVVFFGTADSPATPRMILMEIAG